MKEDSITANPKKRCESCPYAQEAIDNTHKIAERCNVEIEFGVTKLPKYGGTGRFDSWTYLNPLMPGGL